MDVRRMMVVVVLVIGAMIVQESVNLAKVVVLGAMMYLVGVVGLHLLVVVVAELEMEIVNNMPNYLNNIHYYNKNIYNNILHSFQYIHCRYNIFHNLDNILYMCNSYHNLE